MKHFSTKKKTTIYIIKQDIRINLRIDGQTAGPIGLKFLWTLRGSRGGLKAFFQFFSTRTTPGPSASIFHITDQGTVRVHQA